MKAELIFTGTELLLGQILNTNSQYLSQRLSEMGIDLFYHSTIGDNPDRVKEQLKIALNRSNLIITTGGLGPTMDDLTKEMVAEAFGLEMVLDQNSLSKLEQFFVQRGRTMAENNRKQAYFPKGSVILPNDYGTAPGAITEHKGKIVIVLPGPPRENKPMFENYVKPWLETKIGKKGQFLISRMLRLYGIGESTMEEKIRDLLLGQRNPTIAPLFKGGEVNLRVTAKGNNLKDINELIDNTEKEIRARLGKYIFGSDDESLEKVVGNLLAANKKTISIAESCTGGLISSKLTDIPGSSGYFMYGLVTYSNEAKANQLGVKKVTLEKYGAVSSQTAEEMAKGVRLIGNTDFGLAVTGVAGPGGGTLEKPVGLVYVALSSADKSEVKEFRLTGERELVKLLTANAALNMVRKGLL